MLNQLVLQLLRALAKGLFGRVLGYSAFLLGFWLLFQGISRPNVLFGILGSAAILVAMYLMVLIRKTEPSPELIGAPLATGKMNPVIRSLFRFYGNSEDDFGE